MGSATIPQSAIIALSVICGLLIIALVLGLLISAQHRREIVYYIPRRKKRTKRPRFVLQGHLGMNDYHHSNIPVMEESSKTEERRVDGGFQDRNMDQHGREPPPMESKGPKGFGRLVKSPDENTGARRSQGGRLNEEDGAREPDTYKKYDPRRVHDEQSQLAHLIDKIPQVSNNRNSLDKNQRASQPPKAAFVASELDQQLRHDVVIVRGIPNEIDVPGASAHCDGPDLHRDRRAAAHRDLPRANRRHEVFDFDQNRRRPSSEGLPRIGKQQISINLSQNTRTATPRNIQRRAGSDTNRYRSKPSSKDVSRATQKPTSPESHRHRRVAVPKSLYSHFRSYNTRKSPESSQHRAIPRVTFKRVNGTGTRREPPIHRRSGNSLIESRQSRHSRLRSWRSISSKSSSCSRLGERTSVVQQEPRSGPLEGAGMYKEKSVRTGSRIPLVDHRKSNAG